MREPAILSRRALAALPIAALAGAAASAPATLPLPAGADADAELLDFGQQWAAAWDAQVAHDHTAVDLSTMTADEMRAFEAVGDRLFAAEHELFDAIAAMSARTLAGLAVKAQILARTHDVEQRGIDAVEAAAERAHYLDDVATFSLVLDVLKLARATS